MSALAQWQWVDKDGRKVFSDRSPPADILDKNILKRPAGSQRAAAATPAAEPAASGASAPAAPLAKASDPRLTGKDPQLEAKKKQAEEEEAAAKKAEEQKTAKTKAENCTKMRQSLSTFQSGIRVATVNAKGERIVLDDTRRAAETKQLQDSITANCN